MIAFVVSLFQKKKTIIVLKIYEIAASLVSAEF